MRKKCRIGLGFPGNCRLLYLVLMIFLSLSGGKAQENKPVIKGNASYYSDKFHGRKMANGELYHRDSMTCAHRKLPFGTLLKVRNTRNDKSVIVRVTDRGPFSNRLIIDLSRAAARELDFIRAGICPVEITHYHHKIVVPYRAEKDSLPEIPELDLDSTPVATYPDPVWQRDSTGVPQKE